MGKKQPAAWSSLLRSVILSVGIYLLLTLLIALLLVKGILPIHIGVVAVLVSCLLATLLGALSFARIAPWGALPSALLAAAAFGVILIVVGLLGWDSGVTWTGRGGAILLAVLAGGVVAGLTGKKRGRRLKRKAIHR